MQKKSYKDLPKDNAVLHDPSEKAFMSFLGKS